MTTRQEREEKGGQVLGRKGDRRAFLTAATGAAMGATAATLLPEMAKGAEAATGDNMIVGQHNEADPGDHTSLRADVDNGSAFFVENQGGAGGAAIHGDGPYGATGLRGTSASSGPGVLAESESGPGVEATSRNGVGVRATGPGSGVLAEGDWGPGVEAKSDSGPGVFAASRNGVGVQATGPESGVLAESHWGPGVEAMSDSGAGLVAISRNDVGVYATGPGSGVLAESESGRGVAGHSQGGVGVLGTSQNGVGVHASVDVPRDGSLALLVTGKASFSTAGSGVLPRRSNAVLVANPAVTPDSHITVTLTGNPGRASIAWVEQQPGVGFVVHMSRRRHSDVPFTYLIVECAEPPTPQP